MTRHLPWGTYMRLFSAAGVKRGLTPIRILSITGTAYRAKRHTH